MIRTLGFQPKGGSLILLGSKVEGLFYLFALGAIISGFKVITVLSPVASVLWLIMTFISASALFILLEVEFIAFIFLIVYVGAIAILFLFVIMMLNLTEMVIFSNTANYFLAGLIIGVGVLFEILTFLKGTIDGGQIVQYLVVSNPNIEVLGRVLYTDYYYLFIISSFILLVAMIGAIILTHDHIIQDRKGQDIFVQTSRQLWQ